MKKPNVLIFGENSYAQMLFKKLQLTGRSVDGFWVEKEYLNSPKISLGPVYTSVELLLGASIFNGTVFQNKKGPSFIERMDQLIQQHGATWAQLNLSSGCGDIHLSEGAQIFDMVAYDLNCRVGRCSQVRPGAFLGHDVEIDSYCYIAPAVRIGSGSIIKRRSFIGFSATVLSDITIGSNVLVASGAVVRKSVPDNSVVSFDGRVIQMENPFKLI